MKKLVLVALSACLSVLWSCTNEELPMANEEMVPVQFTFDVEGAMSRAISDGTGADLLMYGVFEKVSKTELKQVVAKQQRSISDIESLIDGIQVTINLLRGKTYQVVFWAQNADCKAYTVGNDMKVKIDYDDINNDELRDAFFASKEVTVSGTNNTTFYVTLKRPFAQVNVGAYQTDYKEAQGLGVTVDQSSATFKNVPSAIDLLTGNVSEPVNVTYKFGAIPNEALKGVDTDNDGNHEIYKWVSMSYLLASPVRTTHEMNFVFRNSENENSEITLGPVEYSVQRNYRTNIVGQVLTGGCDFFINIDPLYEDQKDDTDYIRYIFDRPTSIENEIFALNKAEWGKWCIFTAPSGNKDNDLVISFDNVTFSGGLYGIMMGEDWRNDKHQIIPTTYNFNLNKVIAKDIEVANCITSNTDHMSILFYLRGNSNVTNCNWTGTTTVNNDPIDEAGDKEYVGNNDLTDNVAYDCGVPNNCVAKFDNSTIGSMYIWSQCEATLTNCNVKYLRSATLYYTTNINGCLTIGAGTTIDVLDITTPGKYRVSLNILEGAKIKELRLNGRTLGDKAVIAEGTVEKIIP